jgi:hypothetical protein
MEAKTVAIELPSELYDDLTSLAAAEKTDLVQVIAQLVERANRQRQVQTDSPNRALQRIQERAIDLEISDLSEQHDHYLYGVDKR